MGRINEPPRSESTPRSEELKRTIAEQAIDIAGDAGKDQDGIKGSNQAESGQIS